MANDTTRALYFLAAGDEEADPSSYVDLDNGSYPKVHPAGALGYRVELTSSISRIIPHARVLFCEETTTAD